MDRMLSYRLRELASATNLTKGAVPEEGALMVAAVMIEAADRIDALENELVELKSNDE